MDKKDELQIKMVEVFPWNTNFETGISKIDEQHKRLVELLNMLAGHLAFRSDTIALNSIFVELTEYALYHFQYEEDVWEKYLGADTLNIAHKQEHSDFVNDILKLKAEEGWKPIDDILEDVLSFLTHWLAFHILQSDKRMSKVALAVKSGLTLEEAKETADEEMSGVLRVLIETILSMYDSLSSRTLELLREVTERQKAEAKLRLAANVFDNTLDAICITDSDFKIMEANPSFCQVTELASVDVIGKDLSDIKSGLQEKEQIEGFWNTLNESGHWSGIISNRRKTGEVEAEWLTLSVVKNESAAISNYVAVFSNVSHLIQQQTVLEKIAHHDALTGLPNRLLLKDRLSLAVAHSERTKTSLAICYIDLDGFKPVNDKFGHAVGDIVLKELANRFRKIVRSQDTVARLGGDEFVILIGDLKNRHDYKRVLGKVLEDASKPVGFGQNQSVNVSASIGVTVFPDDASVADTLLHHADQAMYEAKRLGKGRFCLYQLK